MVGKLIKNIKNTYIEYCCVSFNTATNVLKILHINNKMFQINCPSVLLIYRYMYRSYFIYTQKNISLYCSIEGYRQPSWLMKFKSWGFLSSFFRVPKICVQVENFPGLLLRLHITIISKPSSEIYRKFWLTAIINLWCFRHYIYLKKTIQTQSNLRYLSLNFEHHYFYQL